MELRFIPTLETQRELYSMPVTMDRFRAYLQMLTGQETAGEPDVVLPIGLVNPMGKAHCADTVAALLAMDAERVVADAAAEAGAALPLGEAADICLNVLDDLGGGWTNRYFYEMELRFGSERGERAARTRRIIVVPAWTSEQHDPQRLRKDTLAAAYRRAWRDVHGRPATLGQQLASEGMALRFAGFEEEDFPDARSRLDAAAEVAEAFADSRETPLQAAFWFGDEVAAGLGYTGLGLGPWAGFRLALARALEARAVPLTGLASGAP